ncbi:MAG TPA: CAP family protein [Polyangia bacterium]|jgi:uncharacterized protein YkwD
MTTRPTLRLAVALAAAALSSWASPPAGAAPPEPRGAPAGDAGVIFTAHNAYRARHCAPPLTWSADVAKVAQAWADRLARDCSFQHSGSSKYGENLWAGTAGAFGPDRVVASWYDEVAKYDYKRPGFSMATGHFTQVVWVETRALGCGTATCKGNRLWVCNYAPPGNVEGQFGRNVLPTSCKK